MINVAPYEGVCEEHPYGKRRSMVMNFDSGPAHTQQLKLKLEEHSTLSCVIASSKRMLHSI